MSRKRCDATWAATYIFPVLVRSPSHRLAFRTCADARHASCLRRLRCSSIVHKQHRLCCHAADADQKNSLLHRSAASSHTKVGSRCDSQARPSCCLCGVALTAPIHDLRQALVINRHIGISHRHVGISHFRIQVLLAAHLLASALMRTGLLACQRQSLQWHVAAA